MPIKSRRHAQIGNERLHQRQAVQPTSNDRGEDRQAHAIRLMGGCGSYQRTGRETIDTDRGMKTKKPLGFFAYWKKRLFK